MPRGPVNTLIENAYTDANRKLLQAQEKLDYHGSSDNDTMADHIAAAAATEEVAEPPFALESDQPEITQWSGWHTLQRRAGMLNNDLQEIVKQTDTISRILRQP